MPITKGAEKALRSSKRKHVYNTRRKNTMNDTVKKMRKLTASGNVREAESMISAAYKAIDKATKTGVIKKNTAARKKSRLMKALRKVSA
jgi:small subunit ribosomal protein S20